jgi:hypothetical protein
LCYLLGLSPMHVFIAAGEKVVSNSRVESGQG